MGQEPIHLPGGEGGGRTAAHVKALHVQPQILCHLCRLGDLPQQHLQIWLHKGKALFHCLGHKAAIGASGGAEGDADVEGNVLGLQIRLGLQTRLGRLDAQLSPGLGNGIGVPQQMIHLPGRHSFFQIARRQLGRADARKGAPGRSHPRDLLGRLEKAQLHRPLAQALLFILVRSRVDNNTGYALSSASVIVYLCYGCSILAAAGQGDGGPILLPGRRVIHRALLGEKRQ